MKIDSIFSVLHIEILIIKGAVSMGKIIIRHLLWNHRTSDQKRVNRINNEHFNINYNDLLWRKVINIIRMKITWVFIGTLCVVFVSTGLNLDFFFPKWHDQRNHMKKKTFINFRLLLWLSRKQIQKQMLKQLTLCLKWWAVSLSIQTQNLFDFNLNTANKTAYRNGRHDDRSVG